MAKRIKKAGFQQKWCAMCHPQQAFNTLDELMRHYKSRHQDTLFAKKEDHGITN